MTFFQSTTIWHFQKQNLFKQGEMRVTFKAMDTVKNAASWTAGKAAGAANIVKWGTLPARLPFYPAWWGLKGMYKGAEFGYEKAKYGAYCGKEIAAGAKDIVWNTGMTHGETFLRDAQATLWTGPKHLFWGAVKAPVNIAASPFRFAGGIMDSCRNGVTGTMDIGKNLLDLDIKGAIKNTRKTISGVITPPISRPIYPIIKPVVDYGKVVGMAKLRYPYAAFSTFKHVRDGVTRMYNCKSGAQTSMAQSKANVVSLADARKKKEAEKTEISRETAKQAKTAGKLQKAA